MCTIYFEHIQYILYSYKLFLLKMVVILWICPALEAVLSLQPKTRRHVEHSMARANLKKSVWLVTNTTTASKFIPRRPRISINWNPPFQTSLHKILKEVLFRLTIFFFRNKKSLSKKQLLFSFLCIVKQKKIRSDPKFFEIFYFWKFTS